MLEITQACEDKRTPGAFQHRFSEEIPYFKSDQVKDQEDGSDLQTHEALIDPVNNPASLLQPEGMKECSEDKDKQGESSNIQQETKFLDGYKGNSRIPPPTTATTKAPNPQWNMAMTFRLMPYATRGNE